jgi:hypothetical protein
MDFFDPLLAWIETSALASWVRGESLETVLVFPVIVTLHTLGMGFLAGGSAALDLRILGVAPSIPLKPLRRFIPLLWLAFAVNAVSGVLLLIAYPTKALTNPLFYIKVGLITLAVWLLYRISATVFQSPDIDQNHLDRRAKVLAAGSLAAWIALITAGRLLAYTHKWEMLGVPSLT